MAVSMGLIAGFTRAARTFLRGSLLFWFFSLLTPSGAFAQVPEQVITPDPVMQTKQVSTAVSFDVIYTTQDPVDETLPGLGLKMYFDSTKLTFMGPLTDVLATNFIAQQPPADDTGDADGDPKTDKFVLISWADINTSWPGVGNTPATLFRANFTTAAEFDESTKVNFTKTSPLDSVATLTTTSAMIIPVPPDDLILMVMKEGDGDGTVTSDPVGIDCGQTCSADFPPSTEVMLMQTPAAGSQFGGFGGDCSADGKVTLDAEKTCTTTFTLIPPPPGSLSVNETGNGMGTVTSSPVGIDCGSACSASFPPETMVMLMATPDANSKFVKWGGDCSEDGKVTIPEMPGQECTAEFMLKPSNLTVTKTGDGDGTVTSSPAGIDCGNDCMEEYPGGTMVMLTGTPDDKSDPVVWSGDCDGSGKVTMDGTDKNCGAEFTLKKFQLTAAKAGTGGGLVTSMPPGIDCGSDCQEEYKIDTMVQLTANADEFSIFDNWTGDCDASGKVTMDAAKSCTANFTLVKAKLSVTKSGNGGGTVSSDPPGIDCGGGCEAPYDLGTMVMLTAEPNDNSIFVGWGGACDENGKATVDMTSLCTAEFELIFALSVNTSGNGGGTVTSTPEGIDCGELCSAEFPAGTKVELKTEADDGSIFGEWTGDCDADGNVTMDAAKDCTAVFDIAAPDHFLCYNIKPKTKIAKEATLSDQFEKKEYKVKKSIRLCNPADKNGEGIEDPESHLQAYKIKRVKGESKSPKRTNVLVENQFGVLSVETKQPDRLLVPTAKSLDGSPEPLDDSSNLDHYKCYKVKLGSGESLPNNLQASVVDQFNQETLYDIKKVERLCNPVDKNGEGIKNDNDENHLLCYKISRAKGEPKHVKVDGISVLNQFGSGTLSTKKVKELCVPSIKTLIEPQ